MSLNKKKRLPVFVSCAFLQQRGVAQIVSHHDGWVQGGEIQGGNRKAVVPEREEGAGGKYKIRAIKKTTESVKTRCTNPFSGSMTVAPV